MTIRPATLEPSDLQTIAHHRSSMFRDMGHADEAALDCMSTRFLPWLRRMMEAGEYLAWFAVEDDDVVAGLGLWLMDWPPHMVASGDRRGNILNVYTEPAYRRRGIARRLMQTALDWCAANGVDAVILHASPDGRALYESIGFQSTNEMRLMLSRPVPEREGRESNPRLDRES